MKKVVFFEMIDTAYRILADEYLNNGFKVYSFKIDNEIGRTEKIRQHIEAGRLVDLSGVIFEYELGRRAAFFAHENVDAVFDKYFSSYLTIEIMEKLLNFPQISDMFKRELLFDLERVYTTQLKINEIITGVDSYNEIHFVPSDNLNMHRNETSLLRKDVKIIEYTDLRILLRKVFERIFYQDAKSLKGVLFLFYPIYLLLKKFGGISNNKKPKEFKIGITIARHPMSIFGMNYLTDTIFIDDAELPKEAVLFIDENGSKNIEGYKKRGWNFTRVLDDRETLSFKLLWSKIVKCFLPAWFKTFFLSLFKEPYFTDTKRRILQDYLIWSIFAENYKIKRYVRRMLPDNISKMHIFSEYGIETWFVHPDNSCSEYTLDWEESKKSITEFSFMYYDNAVIHGNLVERHFKKHRNFIKKYVKTGVLYSQIVHELQKGKLKSSLASLIKEKNLPKKIIGVFDTTYANFGHTKIKDGIQFWSDMVKLVEDFPETGFVFKAMKWPEQTPYFVPFYDKLKNHPRCLLFYMWNQEGISAAEVIAFSDFVISAGYTSPTVEALGANKKAIYYDALSHEIGDKYYYNRYIDFVAHGYEDVKRLTKYWLYEATGEKFSEFLNKYAKDEIDPYLDGKALTRLRKLLMEG